MYSRTPGTLIPNVKVHWYRPPSEPTDKDALTAKCKFADNKYDEEMMKVDLGMEAPQSDSSDGSAEDSSLGLGDWSESDTSDALFGDMDALAELLGEYDGYGDGPQGGETRIWRRKEVYVSIVHKEIRSRRISATLKDEINESF